MSEVEEVKHLRGENARLRRLVAELGLFEVASRPFILHARPRPRLGKIPSLYRHASQLFQALQSALTKDRK